MTTRLVLELPGRPPIELPAKGKLVLGSDRERVDVCIEGQGIEAVHCTIGRLKGGGWALKDLGSDFGCIVNGKRTEGARLKAGDRIVLGSVSLRVQDPLQPTPPKTPATARPPRIPGYDLDRRIGKGATGEVWLATQRSLDRRVALKILSARLEADPTFVERFQAEARAAAALNHPNVVTVHDVGHAEGHHYLSMEYMAGGCLEARVASQGPLPWREALSVLLDAARGLEYAESKGIVHRDIKPANLMQTEEGITKICDLGLAVAVEQEEVNAEGGKVFGTPHFLPPEVLRGQRADARSDLYSLGATAYRILSGHTPFEGETTREILRGVLHDQPQPLIERVPGLPAGISELVMRLLSREPDERPPSAAVVVTELERLIATDGAPRQATAAAGGGGGRRLGILLALLIVAALLVLFTRGSGEDPEAARGGGGGEPLVGTGDAEPPSETAPPGNPNGTESGAGETSESEGPPGGELDDDQAAKLLELEARNALLTLGQSEFTDGERILALRALAERFLGTTAAEEALTQADQLESELESQAGADAARSRERAALLFSLRQAAGLEESGENPDAKGPPKPGPALRALAAVPGQEAFAGDSEFEAGREALVEEILEKALAFAREREASAQRKAEAGDFRGMQTDCAEIVALMDLPPLDPEPPSVARLRGIAARARSLRENAGELESRFARAQRDGDRALIAATLAGSAGAPGLEEDLLALRLAPAEERLAGLAQALRTEPARSRVESWLAEVRRASRALQALREAWDGGEWKRRTVLEPEGSTETAVGVGEKGILVQAGKGNRLIPWERFGGAMRELNTLFKGRLRDGWSPEESAAISALLRLEAVAQAARSLSPSFSPGGPRLSDRSARAVTDLFEAPRDWATRAGDTTSLERETAATELLLEALGAAAQERWSVALTLTERLLSDHRDALLVGLLSDGSPTDESRAEAEPEAGSTSTEEGSTKEN